MVPDSVVQLQLRNIKICLAGQLSENFHAERLLALMEFGLSFVCWVTRSESHERLELFFSVSLL